MAPIFLKLLPSCISQRQDNDFQEFVDLLYSLTYPNFVSIKQKRDKGSDGFIQDEKISIAVYGPQSRDLNKFRRKITDDYEKYMQHWVNNYPIWQVVYNQEFTASEIQILDNLNLNIQKKGVSQLVNLVDELPFTKKKRIAIFLGIDEDYLSNDIFKNVLDDMLLSGNSGTDYTYNTPLYIEEKIELNYNKADIQNAKEQYIEYAEYFRILQNVLSTYTESDQASLRSKIRTKYMQLEGEFKVRFDNLSSNLLEKYQPEDDLHERYIRIVLMYFFEQCLFGKKSKGEL